MAGEPGVGDVGEQRGERPIPLAIEARQLPHRAYAPSESIWPVAWAPAFAFSSAEDTAEELGLAVEAVDAISRHGRVDRIVLFSAALVIGLGGRSLLSADERFVRFCPVIGDLVFAAVLLATLWRDPPLMVALATRRSPDLVDDPAGAGFVRGLQARLALNLLVHAAATAWAALFADTGTWLRCAASRSGGRSGRRRRRGGEGGAVAVIGYNQIMHAYADEPEIPPDPGEQRVLLYDVSWADLERLLKIRGDAPVPRFTYLEGTLEIMSPGNRHETLKKLLARLIEAWADEMEIDLLGIGSWTLKDRKAERAVEPDECYAVDDDHPERPHVAIEIALRPGGIRKLDVYRKLRVREVWIWRRGRLELYALRGEDYEAIERSEVFPALDLDLIAHCMTVPKQSQAVRELRRRLREG